MNKHDSLDRHNKKLEFKFAGFEEKVWTPIKKATGITETDPNDPKVFLRVFVPRDYDPTNISVPTTGDEERESEKPSGLRVSAVNWINYAGCKAIYYINMGPLSQETGKTGNCTKPSER